jgi:hypothetical protein
MARGSRTSGTTFVKKKVVPPLAKDKYQGEIVYVKLVVNREEVY